MAWSSTVVHLIQAEDDPESLQTIINQLPDSLFHLTCTGSSVLHCCVLSDKPLSALKLISNGCNVNLSNDFGETPLHWAVKSNSISACRILLTYGADINAEDSEGNSPLHWACENDNIDILKILLKFPDINFNIENDDGYMPIEVATFNGYYKSVKLFLKYGVHGIRRKKIMKCASYSENVKLIQLLKDSL